MQSWDECVHGQSQWSGERRAGWEFLASVLILGDKKAVLVISVLISLSATLVNCSRFFCLPCLIELLVFAPLYSQRRLNLVAFLRRTQQKENQHPQRPTRAGSIPQNLQTHQWRLKMLLAELRSRRTRRDQEGEGVLEEGRGGTLHVYTCAAGCCCTDDIHKIQKIRAESWKWN